MAAPTPLMLLESPHGAASLRTLLCQLHDGDGDDDTSAALLQAYNHAMQMYNEPMIHDVGDSAPPPPRQLLEDDTQLAIRRNERKREVIVIDDDDDVGDNDIHAMPIPLEPLKAFDTTYEV